MKNFMLSHKKTISFFIISLIATAQFAAFAPKAQACSCQLMELPGDKMAEYALQTYDAIFAGEVIGVSQATPDLEDAWPPVEYQSNAVFKIKRQWKGTFEEPNATQVYTAPHGNMCGYGFATGEQYLVYASTPKTNRNFFATTLCSPTKKLADASEDIKYLNELSGRTAPAPDEPFMPPGGTLNVITKEGEDTKEFPLQHTDVLAEISGFISRVTVTQEFVNHYGQPIEAVYTFPLPQNAAVDAMEMKIGERVIKAQIKKREEARQLYEEAKASGRRAGLLEQERPNIFTQSVANILPGDTILITINYIETLEYERGTYTFVFPMTVGPRYIPFGGMPNARYITPPVLKMKPGERSGHDIALTVNIEAGFDIKDIRSKNHLIIRTAIEAVHPGQAQLTLGALDAIPNKDFVLEYDVGGDEPQFTLLTHKKPGDDHGYFTLIAQPQINPEQSEITPKEMIFVVGSSGSMSGEPISRVKQAMRYALKNLNPNDTFYLFSFSNEVRGLSDAPLSNTPENVEKGARYINDLAGGGGTEMLKGVKAAYAVPKDDNRLRYVVMLTDGYIGNEDQILAEIEAHQNEARFFGLGIGSSPNRYLIEQMAIAGRGLSFYLNLTEDSDKVIRDFYERIANPVLTDIRVEFPSGGYGIMGISEIYPAPITDLFSVKPLYLYGQYQAADGTGITIRGKIRGTEFSRHFDAIFPNENFQNEGLVSIWARQKVKALEASMYRGENPQTVEEITNLALAYNIVTKYTSFVAFEEKPVTDKPGETVRVPVELPEGASYEGIFGAEKERSDIGMAAPSAMSYKSLGQAQDMGMTFGKVGLGAPAIEYPIKYVRSAIRFVSNLLLFGPGVLFLCITLISGLTLAIHASKKIKTPSKAKKNLLVGIIGLIIIILLWTIISYLLGFSASL